MARRLITLSQAAQARITEEREQAERDERWNEMTHSNEQPKDAAANGGADAPSPTPPTDGEETEDRALAEQQAAPPTSEPNPYTSDYQELVAHLAQARGIIWQRINRGHWAMEDHASAAMDAYQDLGKALKRLPPALIQLPLPPTREQ